jgi:hypothetical protein
VTPEDLTLLERLAHDILLRPWRTEIVCNRPNEVDVMCPEGAVAVGVNPNTAQFIVDLVNAAPELIALSRDGLRMREIERFEEAQQRAGR